MLLSKAKTMVRERLRWLARTPCCNTVPIVVVDECRDTLSDEKRSQIFAMGHNATCDIVNRNPVLMEDDLLSVQDPTPEDEEAMRRYFETSQNAPKDLKVFFLADTCAGKTRRVNSIIADVTAGTRYQNIKCPEGENMTTSKQTNVSFLTDTTDKRVRVEVDGTEYDTDDEVNKKLRDALLHPQEAGIDKTNHTSKLSLTLINFQKGIDGIVLCDVPGGATVTSQQDELMMKKCFRATGVTILLTKITNKNSAIIKLASAEPINTHNCRIICFTFCDIASNKNKKDNLSPESFAKLKDMVQARSIIQTSKDNLESLHALIKTFQRLQKKKMYWIYKYRNPSGTPCYPVSAQHKQLLAKPVIESIKQEIQIVLGIKAEHDDETLRSLHLSAPRSPEKWWKTDVFGNAIVTQINTNRRKICAEVNTPSFLSEEEKKLPIFSPLQDTNNMYAENMINQAIQKLERACIHVVEKALNAYLFGSRLDIVGSAIPGYVDDEGLIHFLPTRQQKFLGNLFLMHATKNTEECIAKLKADLAGKTHGYAHWNWKRFLGYQRTKAVALNTLITAPLDDALQYTQRKRSKVCTTHTLKSAY